MSTLNQLRTQFLNTLETVFSYTGDVRYLNSLPFMSATYEYFRKRHFYNVTDFTVEEETQLKQKLPAIYTKLGKEYGLSYYIECLQPKDVFDYARYRSGCQFLIDDVGKFVPDGIEKNENIEELIDSFESTKYLLKKGGSDEEYYEYPQEPAPEHLGVPESHDWWKPIELAYDVSKYRQDN